MDPVHRFSWGTRCFVAARGLRQAGIVKLLPNVLSDQSRDLKEEESIMVQTAIRNRILADLDRLSPEQQRRAAELVHGLVSRLPAGASVDDLIRVSGTLDDDSARQMITAVEEGCERVDTDGW